MEVTKYGIDAPLPHNEKLVRFDAAKKEGHGRTVAEQISSNLIGIYNGVDINDKGRCT